MQAPKLLMILILAGLLAACDTTTSPPSVGSHTPMATGGQDAALFAAKGY